MKNCNWTKLKRKNFYKWKKLKEWGPKLKSKKQRGQQYILPINKEKRRGKKIKWTLATIWSL